MPGPAELTDPRQLRALAHPLRLRLLADLRMKGPGTATDLAGKVGASAALVSYHLRSLAKYGFVEEAPALARDARERWWQAVHEGITWSQASFLDSPERAVAAGALMSEIAEGYAEAARRWLADVPAWSTAWVSAADMSDWPLELTVAQAIRLREELVAVIERYQRDPPETGAEVVRVILHLLPQRRVARSPHGR